MESHPGRTIEIDGEMQADTAIDPILAQRQGSRQPRCGPAPTCSCSPTSTAATSRRKLVQYLANAHSYGQILLGLSRPAADMSRGATAESILGVAAIVGLQAIEYHTLYPE